MTLAPVGAVLSVETIYYLFWPSRGVRVLFYRAFGSKVTSFWNSKVVG
jgi:hypothetical protein